MRKGSFLFILLTACSLSLNAQSDTLSLSAKYAKLLRPRNLAKWDIPAGNYSGITPLGNNHYAVVTDKPKGNGFFEFYIELNEKGKVVSVQNLGFRQDSIYTTKRDMEGIIYHPSTQTVFISAESDQQILEYSLSGQLTGRSLSIPSEFSINKIQSNYGFESLAYSPETHLFWTTTENTLLADKDKGYLRLQSFTEDLQPSTQYIYYTDTPKKTNKKHRHYAFGVPEITALPDSSLFIIERELYISKNYLGSSVQTKIYRIKPSNLSQSEAFTLDQKELITEFRTPLRKLSNYEGMCLGPQLPDGTQTLLLICDSQDNYGNSLFHLKDRIRVILIK